MRSSDGWTRRARDDLREVLAERLRRADAAVPVEADADELDRPAVKLGQVGARQAQQAGDHVDREREGQLTDELGAAPVDERVDLLVDDRRDSFGLPTLHRLAAERLLHEAAVDVVLGRVHLQDGVAHDLAHRLLVTLRRERLAVAKHLLHAVEAVDAEDVLARFADRVDLSRQAELLGVFERRAVLQDLAHVELAELFLANRVGRPCQQRTSGTGPRSRPSRRSD